MKRSGFVALHIVAMLLILAGCTEEEWRADDEMTVENDHPTAAATELPETQEAFWHRLQALCGEAYAGEVEEAPEEDETFRGQDLVMHVRQCTDDTIHIPLHVGEDRSRTWIVSRTDEGLRLKHDHRHEDGTEEDPSQYGGDTADAGTARRQEFPADEQTADMLPEAATNVWTIEVEPGGTFVYALRREGTDRRYRLVFDLSETVEPPPAPWGYEDTEPTEPAGT